MIPSSFTDYVRKTGRAKGEKMRVAMSSGHSTIVRGAAGPEPWGLDEVDEARLLVEAVGDSLRNAGVEVETYHDDFSETQDENLNRIVNWHNAQPPHDLDVSVHFNAYKTTETEPHGVEVLYTSEMGCNVAVIVSKAIADASGLIDRGPKERDDLAFLNGTNEVAVLIETCFCDSKPDCDLYRDRFIEITDAIADGIVEALADTSAEEDGEVLFSTSGKCSWFGGPADTTGVAPDEGLAFIFKVEDAPHLFLPYQPKGTTGLARRLNPAVPYVATFWDNYAVVSKEMLASGKRALVRAPSTGRQMKAWPADTGPNPGTGRVADLSPGLMEILGIETDDEVQGHLSGAGRRLDTRSALNAQLWLAS